MSTNWNPDDPWAEQDREDRRREHRALWGAGALLFVCVVVIPIVVHWFR